MVPDSPWPAAVFDGEGRPVGVTERHRLTAVPCRVEVAGGRSRAVSGWAGPWPVTERWWVELLAGGAGHTAPAAQVPPREAVRVQVALEPEPEPADGDADAGEVALLLVHEGASWWVQGAYR